MKKDRLTGNQVLHLYEFFCPFFFSLVFPTTIAVSYTHLLKLEVSPEKTRIVNTRKRWSEFLGFKIRVRLKHHKYVCLLYTSLKGVIAMITDLDSS